MLNQGKRTIKAMQQILPRLVTIGIAKANCVIRQFSPLNQKEVATRFFQAGPDLKPDEPVSQR
jgi:hypothetical protein